MSYYVKAVTILADTAELNATKTTLKINTGVIHRVEVMFPPGCDGLVHCQLFQAGHQMFPANLGGSFASGAETVGFNDWYEVEPGLTKVTIRAWNLDEEYDHTIRVRIGVLQDWQVTPYSILNKLVESMRGIGRAFGRRG